MNQDSAASSSHAEQVQWHFARTVSRGSSLWRTTRSATLPMNRCERPRRPCVPSAIRSACLSLAATVPRGIASEPNSANRLVGIAQVEGRARGAGSEFLLACDMWTWPD